MRELKKRLLDSVLEQEIYNRKITEQEADTLKIEMQGTVIQQNIVEINSKIISEIETKDQIKETKKKLQRELEKAVSHLEEEKKRDPSYQERWQRFQTQG